MNPCQKSTRFTVNALEYLHEHSWYQRWRNQENFRLGRENSGGLCQDLGTCSTPNVDVKGTFLLMLSSHNIVFQLQFHHIFFTVQNPVTYCSNKNSQHKIYVVWIFWEDIAEKINDGVPKVCPRCPKVCPRCAQGGRSPAAGRESHHALSHLHHHLVIRQGQMLSSKHRYSLGIHHLTNWMIFCCFRAPMETLQKTRYL